MKKHLMVFLGAVFIGYVGAFIIVQAYLYFRRSEVGDNLFLLIPVMGILFLSFNGLFKLSHAWSKFIDRKFNKVES